jgi:hypothetical protein
LDWGWFHMGEWRFDNKIIMKLGNYVEVICAGYDWVMEESGLVEKIK